MKRLFTEPQRILKTQRGLCTSSIPWSNLSAFSTKSWCIIFLIKMWIFSVFFPWLTLLANLSWPSSAYLHSYFQVPVELTSSSSEGSFLVELYNLHPCADTIITISYRKETKKIRLAFLSVLSHCSECLCFATGFPFLLESPLWFRIPYVFYHRVIFCFYFNSCD